MKTPFKRHYKKLAQMEVGSTMTLLDEEWLQVLLSVIKDENLDIQLTQGENPDGKKWFVLTRKS